MKPEITVEPRLAVIDEKVRIIARGLIPDSPVTVEAFIYHSHFLYLGYGHFYARSDGTVDVSEQVSYGGSYRGRLAMGLFTSMFRLPTKKADGKLGVVWATEKLKFEVSVWKGHKTQVVLCCDFSKIRVYVVLLLLRKM